MGVAENILVYASTELALVAESLDIWSAGVDIWSALIAELLVDSVSDVFGLIQDHLEQDMVSLFAQLPAFRQVAAGSFAGHMCFQRGFFNRKSASSQNKKISYKSEVDATSVPNEGKPPWSLASSTGYPGYLSFQGPQLFSPSRHHRSCRCT